MTKPVTRALAVDCLLWRISQRGMTMLVADTEEPSRLITVFRCTICGGGVLPGHAIQFDHVHSDVMGGEHGYKNLRPVHTECHKSKTANDIAANSKVKRIQKGGKTKRGKPIKSRPFSKEKRSFRGKPNART